MYMKTKSFYLFLLCLLSVMASASVSTEYQDVMTSALAKLDVSTSQSNYLQCKNQFERIA
ncbi:hypothetical protein AGMMS49574_06800 [Bacteroidia bacterium]|nr:hypothetical protein AGMMS49574_06800 [Bacteroidia bacterium]